MNIREIYEFRSRLLMIQADLFSFMSDIQAHTHTSMVNEPARQHQLEASDLLARAIDAQFCLSKENSLYRVESSGD